MNGRNWLRRAALLALALAVTAGSALAVGEEFIRVEDTAAGLLAFPLEEEYPEAFAYGVPENGVAVLAFFGVNCPNSQNFFRTLSRRGWADDERVRVTAVEFGQAGGDPAKIQAFADSYMGGRVQSGDIWYNYNGSGGGIGWAYADLLLGSSGFTMPLVALVTEEDGTRFIRWSGSGVRDAAALDGKISALLGGALEEPEEDLPASAGLLGEDCGGGTASFAAGISNRSGGALSGWLWAAGYAGGCQRDLTLRALALPAGGSCEERFSVEGDGARLFFLDEDLRPLMRPLEAGRP